MVRRTAMADHFTAMRGRAAITDRRTAKEDRRTEMVRRTEMADHFTAMLDRPAITDRRAAAGDHRWAPTAA
jgi:hypothetical protein